MLGIMIPDGGKIGTPGMDISRELMRIKERIGYLPENATVYGEFTVWKNLEFFAIFAGDRSLNYYPPLGDSFTYGFNNLAALLVMLLPPFALAYARFLTSDLN